MHTCTIQRITEALCTPWKCTPLGVPIVGYLLFICDDMTNKSDISARGHLSKDFWTSANLQCFRDKSLFKFFWISENLSGKSYHPGPSFYGQCQEVFRAYLSTSFPRGERLLGYMLLFIFTLAFPLYSFHWRRLNFQFGICTFAICDIRKCRLYTSEVHMKKNSRVKKLWSNKCSDNDFTCKNSTVKVTISKIMKIFHAGTVELYTYNQILCSSS